jgi:hypothetical protein
MWVMRSHPKFGHALLRGGNMKYRVHRFNIKMTTEQRELEQFLNSLEGEIVAIIPNITLGFFWAHRVDFLLIIEKVS